MSRMLAILVAASGLLMASQARADVTVLGGGFAEECSKAAKAAAMARPPRGDALDHCTLAIETEVLGSHELAATHVNRGVIYLTQSRWDDARSDFDAAVRIEPGLGEAYVNRGAAFIGEGDNQAGITEIDRGLALNPTEPEKAYFNRALAKERLNDLKGAYFDYLKAEELKPDWNDPKVELARFHVEQR